MLTYGQRMQLDGEKENYSNFCLWQMFFSVRQYWGPRVV